MSKKPTSGQRVYSYIRFSTPEQKEGDSERRQADLAKQFAEKRGLPLDQQLRLKDEGRSGFHGTNRKKGALGQFLKAIEDGQVMPGSILLVENVDRLSREDFLQAFETITRIIRAGVMIVTLSPLAEYTRESIAGGLIWQLVGQMQGAYEESKKKSERIRRARDEARRLAHEEHRMLTSRAPAWLNATTDRQFELNATAAKTIRLIFDLKLKGVGTRTIETRLNSNGYWKPPKNSKRKTEGWRASYIKKILTNPAVIGEYQPHLREGGTSGKRVPIGEPIQDYFPQVVAPEVFYAVQKRLAANKGTGGQTGKMSNVLRHLVKCAYCGGTMAFVDKGKRAAMYLICDNGRRGVKCKSHSIRYDECETAILENCHRIRPDQVLPKQDERTKECESLRRVLAGLQTEAAKIDRQLANLTDRVADAPTKEIAARVYTQMAAREQRQKELIERQSKTEEELRAAERSVQSFINWQNSLADLQKALGRDDPELRCRLNAHLRELIDRIEVFACGHPHEYDANTETGDNFEEWFEEAICLANPSFRPDRRFRQFAAYVVRRRMTKEGRFLRIHFKRGMTIDIVPPGSIATGLIEPAKPKSGWKPIRPDIDRLWREFEKQPAASSVT